MYKVSGIPLVKRSANLMMYGGSGCFLICRLIACMKADSGLIATGGCGQNIKSMALQGQDRSDIFDVADGFKD